MCKKLIFLTSFVFVLGVAAGVTNAEIIAYWPFDEGSGDVAADVVGGFDAQLTNVDWVAGQFGGSALETDRSGDLILAGPGPTPTTQDLTLAFWMVDNWDSYCSLMHKTGESNVAGYMLMPRQNEPDCLLFRIGGYQAYGGWGEECSLPDGAYADGEWVHIVCTYDSAVDTATIYVNGALVPNDNNKNPKIGGIAGPDGYCQGVNDPTHPLRIVETSEPFGGIVDEVAIWDNALTANEVLAVYTLGPLMLDPGAARGPSPEDEATDVPRETVLSWSPGEGATTHNVYLGTVFDDVNDAVLADAVSAGQTATTYDPPGRLDLGQTYYWRIDETVGGAPITGPTWSFTVEPVAYPVENVTATASSNTQDQGPEKTVDGSGLTDDLHSDGFADMWISAPGETGPAWIQYEFDKVLKLHEMLVWNYNDEYESVIGAGCKDVTIEYSVNGTDFTPLGTTHEFARAPGAAGYAANTTVDFEGAAAKYVKLTANTNWEGILDQFGLSEVRFFSIPVQASQPSPDSGATDVAVEATLSWRAGREADKHDVYLSTDEQAVIDGTAPVTTVTDASYSTTLDLDSTYYWRVDEVNDTPVAPAPAYDQNFDSLAAGTNLQSADGWEGWFGDETVAGLVTSAQAYSGNNSMESMKPVDACPNWDRITSGTWTLTTMQYVPSTVTTGDNYYGVLSGYVREPLAWITEVVSDFATGKVRISGDGGTAEVDLVRDAWAEIRSEFDFDSNVSNFYYNGQLLGTRGADKTVGLEGFDLWANNDDAIYYDDFLLVPAATPGGTTWQGDIWSFSTSEFLVVDDFEDYNDIPSGEEGSNLVYMTWMDGYVDPPAVRTNGSTIGYTVPFEPTMETSIVRGGDQSAPLFYDNTTASYSEVTANTSDLAIGRDWTKGGAKTLVLWVRIDLSIASASQLYVKISGTKVLYDGDISVPGWKQWSVDLASVGTNLSNVTTLSIGVDGGGSGMLLVDEIALYQIAPPVIEVGEPSLVGHWKLDETSGLTAADSSGYNNHGTLVGMTGTDWTEGIKDGALMLDGASHYVNCGNDPSLRLTGDVTISAWVKMDPANEGAYMGIGGKLATGPYNGYSLVRHSSNVFRLWMGNDGGDLTSADSDVTYNDTDWHHVVGVMANNTGSLYVDGVKQTIEGTCGLVDSGDYAYIGKQYSTQDDRSWKGIIDDFRIYNRALSAQEISGL